MTKQDQHYIERSMKKALEDARLNGMKIGATGILGAVLDMCNEGESVEFIKRFCEDSLNKKEMKIK